jgi:hypothetical protein
VIWVVISVVRCGIRHTSARCVGMYICRISHGVSGWLFIFMIWRYGEILAGVGILVIFPGNVYLLWISVRSPPSTGSIRHSLLNASCERMCVVENKFEIGKKVLDVFCRFVCSEFGFLDMYEGGIVDRVVN